MRNASHSSVWVLNGAGNVSVCMCVLPPQSTHWRCCLGPLWSSLLSHMLASERLSTCGHIPDQLRPSPPLPPPPIADLSLTSSPFWSSQFHHKYAWAPLQEALSMVVQVGKQTSSLREALFLQLFRMTHTPQGKRTPPAFSWLPMGASKLIRSIHGWKESVRSLIPTPSDYTRTSPLSVMTPQNDCTC